NRILLILLNKVGCRMGLSRIVDHIKPLLRPKSDQQFSHSLGTQRTFTDVLPGKSAWTFWLFCPAKLDVRDLG
ncbi:hypothetical protein NLN86_22225, partial [Citrobacter portucalensis]